MTDDLISPEMGVKVASFMSNWRDGRVRRRLDVQLLCCVGSRVRPERQQVRGDLRTTRHLEEEDETHSHCVQPQVPNHHRRRRSVSNERH